VDLLDLVYTWQVCYCCYCLQFELFF